jgi:hypothetical protein
MRTRKFALAAAVAAIVAGGVALPAPAFASGTGTITIELVSPSGNARELSGVMVILGEGTVWSADALTDSTGRATFTGVPDDVHITATVAAQGPTANYVLATKSKLEVKSGKTLTEKVPFDLGATITGTVTAGGTPLSDVDVELLSSSGNAAEQTETRTFFDIATNSSGVYSIAGIPTGSYRVQFNSPKWDSLSNNLSVGATTDSWSFWHGFDTASTTSWTSATPISVKQEGSHAASDETTVNGTVTAGFTLDGTVCYWSPESSHAGQGVLIEGSHAADTFSAALNNSGELSVHLAPDKYRIGIAGDVDPIVGAQPLHWYVSNTSGPTLTYSDATWITVSANTDIAFIPAPH